MSKGKKLKDIDEETSALVKSYKIPRKEKEKERKDFSLEIAFESREYQQDVLPHLKQNFYLRADSEKNYHYVHCYIINNASAIFQFEARRKELKTVNLYTEKDIAVNYAFLEVRTLDEALQICKEGLSCGNRIFGSLGKANLGVYLSRYSDVVTAAPSVPGTSGVMIIFKVIKGRSKLMPVQSAHMEPTPNFDSHIAKVNPSDLQNAPPLQLFEALQIYMYEYEDTELSSKVRGICPFAVVTYDYGSLMSRPKEFPVWAGNLSCGSRPNLQKVQLMSGLGKMKPYSLGKCLQIKKLTTYQCALDWQPVTELTSDAVQPFLYKKREIKLSNGMSVSLFRLVNDRSDEFKILTGKLAKNSAVAIATLRGDTMLLLFPTGELSDRIGIPRYNDACNSLHCLVIGYRSCVTGLSHTKDPYDFPSLHQGKPPGCHLNFAKLRQENIKNSNPEFPAIQPLTHTDTSSYRNSEMDAWAPTGVAPSRRPPLMRTPLFYGVHPMPPPLVPNIFTPNFPPPPHLPVQQGSSLPLPLFSRPFFQHLPAAQPSAAAASSHLHLPLRAPLAVPLSQTAEVPLSQCTAPSGLAAQGLDRSISVVDEDLRFLTANCQRLPGKQISQEKHSGDANESEKSYGTQANSASLFDPRLARLIRMIDEKTSSESQNVEANSEKVKNTDAVSSDMRFITLEDTPSSPGPSDSHDFSADHGTAPVIVPLENTATPTKSSEMADFSAEQKNMSEIGPKITQKSHHRMHWPELSQKLSENAASRAKHLNLSTAEKAIVIGTNLPVVPMTSSTEIPDQENSLTVVSPDILDRPEKPVSVQSSTGSSVTLLTIEECEASHNRLVIEEGCPALPSTPCADGTQILPFVDKSHNKELLLKVVEHLDDSIFFESCVDHELKVFDGLVSSFDEDEGLTGEGVLMPDDLIFLKTQSDDVDLILSCFYQRMREGKADWSMKVHSQMVLKMADSKKNLDPNSAAHERVTKILISLTRYRNLGRVELLAKHDCDMASRASKDYLNCLAKIKRTNGNRHCILLSNLSPDSVAAKEYISAGIRVQNVQCFKKMFLKKT